MTHLQMNGQEMIHGQQGPVFNWYRSISNDTRQWADTRHAVKAFDAVVSDDCQTVTVSTALEATWDGSLLSPSGGSRRGLPYRIVYTIHADGAVDLDAAFDVPEGSELPRVGLQMMLPAALENVEWYGRGPMENYPDRSDCAFVGRYKSTVDGMREHYVRTQSMGERCDTRWLTLTDRQGKGLRIEAPLSSSLFAFSAQHWTDREVWEAKYDHELDNCRRAEVVLCLDAAMRGLGNASCGPAQLPQYNVKGGQTYSLSLRLASEQ